MNGASAMRLRAVQLKRERPLVPPNESTSQKQVERKKERKSSKSSEKKFKLAAHNYKVNYVAVTAFFFVVFFFFLVLFFQE